MSHKKTLYKPEIVGAYMNMICSFDSTRTTKLVKKAREAYNAESENEPGTDDALIHDYLNLDNARLDIL